MSDTSVTFVFNCNSDNMKPLVEELKMFSSRHELGSYFVIGEDIEDHIRSITITDAEEM